MPKLVPIKFKKLVKILRILEFEEIRSCGSHHFFEHPDGRVTTVPFRQNELGQGLLKKILRDIKLSTDEYENLRQKH